MWHRVLHAVDPGTPTARGPWHLLAANVGRASGAAAGEPAGSRLHSTLAEPLLLRSHLALSLLQRSPPWRDLQHDLSRRSRLLHVAHPFSTVLSASKVRAACSLLSDPSYRVTAKFEWYSSWLSTFAWSDVEYQHATRCCC